MSTLKPDFDSRARLDAYYVNLKNATFIPEEETPVEPIKLEELIKQIDDYSRRFSEDEKLFYSYAKQSSKMALDKLDSIHYFDLFITFFIRSLEKTFPDNSEDVKKLQKSLTENKKAFAEVIKNVNIQNTYYVSALLGMIRGLL